MTGPGNKRLLAALEANWQAEMEGHHTYTAFAKDEVDPQRRNALRGLAAAERHHADLWAGRIQELGAPAPQYTGHPSGQAGSFANRVGGADLALRRLEIDEARDIARYGKQAEGPWRQAHPTGGKCGCETKMLLSFRVTGSRSRTLMLLSCPVPETL
jgi:hypothetical protein